MPDINYQEYFERLDIMYEQCLTGADPETSLSMFLGGLRKVHGETHENPNPDVSILLAKHWLNYFKLRLDHGTVENFINDEVTHLDKFISLVAKHGLIETLAQDADQASIIAYVCARRVHLGETNHPHRNNWNVGDLLFQWAKEQPTSSPLASTNAVINLLYGPATWDLYRDDSGTTFVFLRDLWALNLPLTGMRTHRTGISNSETLPVDLA